MPFPAIPAVIANPVNLVPVEPPVWVIRNEYISYNVGTYNINGSGGEIGNATGFVVCMLVYNRAVTNMLSTLVSAQNGWGMNSSSSLTTFGYYGASNALVQVNAYQLMSKLHKLSVLIYRYNGSSIRPWLDLGEMSTPTSAATQTFRVGTNFTANINSRDIVGIASFIGTPADAQIKDYAQRTRLAGDLPATMDGATPSHRWSLKDELTGTTPVDGQLAPAQLTDRVTGATADNLLRSGTSPKVYLLPLTGRNQYGLMGFTAGRYLSTVTNGYGGSTSGFWFGALFKTIVSNNNMQVLVSCNNDSTAGYCLYLEAGSSNFVKFAAKAADGSTITGANMPVMSNSAVYVIVKYDAVGGKWYTTHNDQEASLTNALGYTPQTGPLTIGYGTVSGAAAPTTHTEIYGAGCGPGIPTLAQIQTACMQSYTTGRFVPPIAGGSVYDLTQDISPNPDALPTQIQDRSGSAHLTVPSGLYVSKHRENIWSYDTKPINYHISGFSANNYYDAPVNAFAGTSGFTVTLMLIVNTQAVTSASRRLFCQRSGVSSYGWSIHTSTTNANIIFQVGNSSGAMSFAVGSTSANYIPVGNLVTVVGVYDSVAKTANIYCSPYLVRSTPFAVTTYAPTAQKPMIGRQDDATTPEPADGVSILGCQFTPYVATLPQIQKMCNEMRFDERMHPLPDVPIGSYYDITQDIIDAGGVAPTTVLDRGTGGVNFTLNGSLSVGSSYERKMR